MPEVPSLQTQSLASEHGPQSLQSCEVSGSNGGLHEDNTFWDTVQRNFIVVDRRFRDAYCLRHLALKMVVIVSAVLNASHMRKQ
jgi:hypothetical protein